MRDSQFEELDIVDLSDIESCKAYSDRLAMRHLMEQQKRLYGKFGHYKEFNICIGFFYTESTGLVPDIHGESVPKPS